MRDLVQATADGIGEDAAAAGEAPPAPPAAPFEPAAVAETAAVPRGARLVVLPDLRDVELGDAVAQLRALELVPAPEEALPDAQPSARPGHVHLQEPAAGTHVARRSQVRLWIPTAEDPPRPERAERTRDEAATPPGLAAAELLDDLDAWFGGGYAEPNPPSPTVTRVTPGAPVEATVALEDAFRSPPSAAAPTRRRRRPLLVAAAAAVLCVAVSVALASPGHHRPAAAPSSPRALLHRPPAPASSRPVVRHPKPARAPRRASRRAHHHSPSHQRPAGVGAPARLSPRPSVRALAPAPAGAGGSHDWSDLGPL